MKSVHYRIGLKTLKLSPIKYYFLFLFLLFLSMIFKNLISFLIDEFINWIFFTDFTSIQINSLQEFCQAFTEDGKVACYVFSRPREANSEPSVTSHFRRRKQRRFSRRRQKLMREARKESEENGEAVAVEDEP